MRCITCGRKLKKKAKFKWFDEQFGASTIDELAQAIYTTFHGHDSLSDEPWELFTNQDCDVVVTAFRDAAYAAGRAITEADIGRQYDKELDW